MLALFIMGSLPTTVHLPILSYVSAVLLTKSIFVCANLNMTVFSNNNRNLIHLLCQSGFAQGYRNSGKDIWRDSFQGLDHIITRLTRYVWNCQVDRQKGHAVLLQVGWGCNPLMNIWCSGTPWSCCTDSQSVWWWTSTSSWVFVTFDVVHWVYSYDNKPYCF